MLPDILFWWNNDMEFVNDCSLYRCDDLFLAQKADTYINVSLGQQSRIDYILTSATNDIT